MEVRIVRINRDLFCGNCEGCSDEADVVVRVRKRSLRNLIRPDVFSNRTGQRTGERIIPHKAADLIGQFRIRAAVDLRLRIRCDRNVLRKNLAGSINRHTVCREHIVAVATGQACEGGICNAQHILAVKLTVSPVQHHGFATNHNREFRSADSRITVIHLGIKRIVEVRIVRVNRDLFCSNCEGCSDEADVVVRIRQRSLCDRIFAHIFAGFTLQRTGQHIIANKPVDLIGQLRICLTVDLRLSIRSNGNIFRNNCQFSRMKRNIIIITVITVIKNVEVNIIRTNIRSGITAAKIGNAVPCLQTIRRECKSRIVVSINLGGILGIDGQIRFGDVRRRLETVRFQNIIISVGSGKNKSIGIDFHISSNIFRNKTGGRPICYHRK